MQAEILSRTFRDRRPEPRAKPWIWENGGAVGTQWLPVSGLITQRLLVTYRAPVSQLSALAPAPFILDEYEGFGFLSVCALEVRAMGVRGMPSWLRFDNREFLYRLAVRFRGEPTFVTLRSDVSARPLALLGRHFSHYRPQRAQVSLVREGRLIRFESTSRDGRGDATLEADLTELCQVPDSVFPTLSTATEFLLGMGFSADATPAGRVRVQAIEHDPWAARWVQARTARFALLRRLTSEFGIRWQYDHTLATGNIRQTWRAARWA